MNLTPHSIIPFELTDISGSSVEDEREHIETKNSKPKENIKKWKTIINKRLKLVSGGEAFRKSIECEAKLNEFIKSAEKCDGLTEEERYTIVSDSLDVYLASIDSGKRRKRMQITNKKLTLIALRS